jgi:acetyl esterase/lipase
MALMILAAACRGETEATTTEDQIQAPTATVAESLAPASEQTAATATDTPATPLPTETHTSTVPKAADDSGTGLAEPIPHEGVQTTSFCTVDGVDLLMDVYYPSGFAGNAPAVLYVHGGGWTSGSRDLGTGFSFVPGIVEQGFVVFAVDYRLAPEYPFPAQIQDVQCAVRSIRANASLYGIDPDRIGAIGGSAGGHLVDLLGTAEDGDFPIVGGYAGYSGRVSVVVGMFGATDFSDPNMRGHNASHVSVFGSSDPNSAQLQAAGSVNYVDDEDADFLLIHGVEDDVVPVTQTKRLEAALNAAGVEVRAVYIENAGHGFAPSGGVPSLNRAEIAQLIVEFVSAHL